MNNTTLLLQNQYKTHHNVILFIKIVTNQI